MLRKHWKWVQKVVVKCGGIFANTQKMWPSGHNLADITQKTKDVFFVEENRHYKFVDIWTLLKKSLKFSGGSEAASGEPKRTKVSANVDYSTSRGCASIDLNMAEEDPDNFMSTPNTQSRLMGTRAAKRKAKGKEADAANAVMPPPKLVLDKVGEGWGQAEDRAWALANFS